jgi:hypothetical protein
MQGAAVRLPLPGCAFPKRLVQLADVLIALLYPSLNIESIRQARKLFRIFKSVDEYQAIVQLVFYG